MFTTGDDKLRNKSLDTYNEKNVTAIMAHL